MAKKSEAKGWVSIVIDEMVKAYGDEAGPFSPARARLIQADDELERIGLGFQRLRLGEEQSEERTLALLDLATRAANGEHDAFEAAMRYVSLRLEFMLAIPPELAQLATDVLLGIRDRPPRRKATSTGLSVRDLAVYMAVEIAITVGASASDAYDIVASELLHRSFHPNNAKTVKRIHLEVRRYSPEDFNLHHLNLISKTRIFPSNFMDLRPNLAFDRWLGKKGHD